jgi:CO/xanthine dehydrogenase FAD-binding subunit
VVARRGDGVREIPAEQFFVGLLTTALEPDELLTEVRFRALPPGAGWGFQEVARRHGDFALVGAAAVVGVDADGTVTHCRLALFGAGPTAVRAHEAEQALLGGQADPRQINQAAALTAGAISPDSDLHATAEYRVHVAGVLSERALSAAVARAGKVTSA